jgi:hypothetical protein
MAMAEPKGSELNHLDELEEELMAEDELSEEPTGRRRIFTEKSDPPVSALHDRYHSGDMILDPHFQRREVWDNTRASRLVESVMLEVPLPVVYVAEGQDGKEEVIDGQQRLKALFRFLQNEYSLKSLRALTEHNGKLFKDLDKSAQRLIRNCSIRTVTFKKESDENLRFDIFERLNTGAIPLNDQELRNCIYHGPYNQLLIELSQDPDYQFLMGLKGPEKRMKDVEYVLRFAAFFHATYLKYKPSMARFLNEDMKKHRNVSSGDAADLRKAFKTSVALVRSLLGSNAFKRYYRGKDQSPDGRWETKKFNASLYDVLMYGFSGADKNQVMSHLDAIFEALLVLMTEDQDFIDSIELSTSAVKMVKYRFDAWRKVLESILGQSSKQPRCFSRSLKEELFKANRTCQICDQAISDIDDSALDHIEQYWRGGKTIPENARLAHRYCNWRRSKSD